MSNSDDSEKQDDNEYVFYKDRPEWSDVTPIPQDDGDNPVVKIAYTDKFKDCYDYFRGILQTGEKSERALALTKDAIELNPANYTVWQYRRDILFELNKDLWSELEYVKYVALENSKNYQIWHHRRVIVEKLGCDAGPLELELTSMVLKEDAKNYHAWQHRQWVLKQFKLYEFELEYVDELINDDIRNNSAWNQRYFVINNTTGFTADDVLRREIMYTLEKITIAKENESAWNYLRGLLLHDDGGQLKNTVVAKYCQDLYKSGNRSPLLLAFIVDMCEELFTTAVSTDDGGGGDTADDNKWYTMELALDICNQLADVHDTIRATYWRHVADNLHQKLQSDTAAAGASN